MEATRLIDCDSRQQFLATVFRLQTSANLPDARLTFFEGVPARMNGVGAEHERVWMLDG